MAFDPNKADANEILEQINGYILKLARQKLPRTITREETLDLDIDELAQHTRNQGMAGA